jgi:hypothetical protein
MRPLSLSASTLGVRYSADSFGADLPRRPSHPCSLRLPGFECNRLIARRGALVRVFVDNGSEFFWAPDGSLGLPSPCPTRLQPTGKTHG